MNKTLIAIVVIIIIIAGGWYVYQGKSVEPVSEPTQTVKIGVTLPLSGGVAFLGEAAKNAVELAMADLGTTKYKYEVVFEDDKFDSATGATTANKLINLDKVDAMLSFGSPVGNVVSPIAEKAKVVHFGVASDPVVAIGTYNFNHWTPPYEETKLMTAELVKRGIKTAILLEQNQPGVLSVTNVLKPELEAAGVKLVASEKFNTGTRDFRSVINKVKNVKADIYLLEVTSPELETLTKQIKEAGIKTPLTSIESFEFTDQPQLFEGSWYVNAADQTPEFISKYSAKYGSNPKLASGNGYDIAKLIVYAFEKVGDGKTKPSSDAVVAELLKVKNFDGAMGKLNIDQDGLVVTKAVVRMIKDGKPVTLTE